MGLRRSGRRRHEDTPAALPPHGEPAVELRGVRRSYARGATTVHALRGIDLSLPRGSFTAVMGPSGSGKSTFLQCAAGLDLPTEGSVRLGGTEITGMNENELTELRRSRLGFVFQAFNLLPSLTVEQNVLLPMRLAGGRQDHDRAADLLERVGLGGNGRRRPAELSGGQQQRVALARAPVGCAARAGVGAGAGWAGAGRGLAAPLGPGGTGGRLGRGVSSGAERVGGSESGGTLHSAPCGDHPDTHPTPAQPARLLPQRPCDPSALPHPIQPPPHNSAPPAFEARG
ncbi:ABC transporter ATP-binding protein, partial [Streptomyces sp. NPDC048357]|uniref:ABC transporter ATP-binding protein n=1 Tax=Streptomyces sp. NPDC048357 TaxID=3154719 RepID=UPI003438B314